MSIEAARKILDGVSELVCCEGTVPVTERIAIALPDGDLGAVDDPKFVDWLLAHAELAPFGHNGQTKLDPGVRQAHRLIARDKAKVGGFDPQTILGEIEAALSPREHLDARLTDVLIYGKGGHFARHKDTPRDTDLVGTLVVGLPIAHVGGVFKIGGHEVDWSGTANPDELQWVALYADADHEIEPITKGVRVTLVYSLSRTSKPRDGKRDPRLAKLARITLPEAGPLMIACARQVIAETANKAAVLPTTSLRGLDREIADVLVESGFDVCVRPCVLASESESGSGSGAFGGELYDIARLKALLTPKIIRKMDEVVSFGDTADYDGEDMSDSAACLGPFILDLVPMTQWVIRAHADATLIAETEMFSNDGYFGNEGFAAHIYSLAALEVTRGKGPLGRQRLAATKTKQPAAKKPIAKKQPAAKKNKPAAKKKR